MQYSSHEHVSILHELDLGQHTLIIISDGGIDLLAHTKHLPTFTGNALHLNSDETYRLFISLQEQWKHKEEHQEDETKTSSMSYTLINEAQTSL